MPQHPSRTWRWGRLVVVHPAGNTDFADASSVAWASVRECRPNVPRGTGRVTAPSLTGMEIANVFTLECELGEEHDGFRIRETQIGPQLGADLIGGSVYEIDPGKKLWPYHLHHANEEWMVVLRGRPTLRTPEGERELVEGDVACFLRGAAGAHQVRNATEEPVRILMLSTLIVPEILEYPDSDKLDTVSAKGERILLTRHAEPAKYWDGES